ncbi:MAG TPA: transporter substrate-binding domain-containing protein, partial [Ideonella sp.]|nr:transporter substrate-binding domain-containing protein [Ideonella sp.]
MRRLAARLRAAGGMAACCLGLLAAGQPTPAGAAPGAGPSAVRVGVMASFPPLQLWPEAASAPGGADIDLLHAIEQPSGLRFEFARYTAYADLERDLLAGKVQVATSMAYTPERAGTLRFTSPYYTMEQAIVARQDESEAEASSALFSRRQAVVRGFAHESVGAQRIPPTPRVESGDLEQALRAVQRGEADWVLDAEPVLRHLIERDRLGGLQVLRQFGYADGQLRLAVRLQDAALAERLERALATLAPQQAGHWVDDWTSRSLATTANGRGLQLGAAESAQLATVHPLRVGYFAGVLPFSDRRADGNPEGLGVDIARATLDRLGLKVERWVPLTLAGMLDAARRGEIDMAIGLADAPERHAYLRFIGAYYADPLVLVSRQRAGTWSLPQLIGQRVALPTGHVLTSYLASQFPGIRLLACERLAGCLRMVDSGQADATLGGLMTMQARLATGDYPHLLIAGALERMSNEHSLSVTWAHEAIAPLLRRSLADVQAAELPSLQRKWSPHRDAGLPWPEVLRWSVAALAAALLLGGGAAWHNRKLRRQVALRHAAQQQAEQERGAAERYLAFLAHEVRNSLHAVKAGVALLATEPSVGRAPTAADLS